MFASGTTIDINVASGVSAGVAYVLTQLFKRKKAHPIENVLWASVFSVAAAQVASQVGSVSASMASTPLLAFAAHGILSRVAKKPNEALKLGLFDQLLGAVGGFISSAQSSDDKTT